MMLLDCRIDLGNSGGPLCNPCGEVIGVAGIGIGHFDITAGTLGVARLRQPAAEGLQFFLVGARMRIRYAGDGTVRSEDAQFSREIENVLNLNWSRLKLNRRAVTESVIQVLSRNRGARTHREIQRLIDRWNEPLAGEKLREYCDVAVYYLKKKLDRTR